MSFEMEIQNGILRDDGLGFHIEICQKYQSALNFLDIVDLVKSFLKKHGTFMPQYISNDNSLKEHVEKLSVFTTSGQPAKYQEIPVDEEDRMSYYVYRLHNECEEEMMDEDDGELPAAINWVLPSQSLLNSWDSLIYDSDIKQDLISYATTGLLFVDKGVNQDLISWNRVVLLHGPPGTGKTSLCRALAQKITIRLSSRFSCASLLEVNSHSLFSKWFSESGKLIMKLFKKVEELVEDEHHLVFLLIDEVESLTASREAVSSGVEPSDAIRVVNALLTQIDHLKRYKNVLILTTSNVTGKIDSAFVDRADIKFYVPLPSPKAIYHIYKSCIDELTRVGIITPQVVIHPDPSSLSDDSKFDESSNTLLRLSTDSVGLSGRSLRKLPFLAFANHCQGRPGVDFVSFAHALSRAIDNQFKEKDKLSC